MYERLDECPVCENGQLNNREIITDYSISKESFALVNCPKCDFVFTNPRPNRDNLGKYYESEDYVSHSNKANSLVNIVYKMVRSYTLQQKVSLVKRHAETSNALLDIGCGTGHFLQAASKKGITVEGVEPSDVAREQAQQLLGKEIADSIFIRPQDKKIDVVTMWHVLEHLPDLNESIDYMKGFTTKKGTYFIAVPNLGSWDANHYKEHWAALDVPRHLYHFTQGSMKELMKKHGMRIKETLPMKFDSYYVSMLSERYKNEGKNNYLAAVQNGLKSNQWAKKNNNNYSSLIYVIKKK